MASHDELVSSFAEVTGVDAERALFYLESSAWQLEVRQHICQNLREGEAFSHLARKIRSVLSKQFKRQFFFITYRTLLPSLMTLRLSLTRRNLSLTFFRNSLKQSRKSFLAINLNFFFLFYACSIFAGCSYEFLRER